jgi:hypothetical protein
VQAERCNKAKKSKTAKKATAPKSGATLRDDIAQVAPTAPKDDGLDIPASLKVENRKPLAPEQRAKVEAAKPKETKPTVSKTVKVTKPAKALSMSRALKDIMVAAPKTSIDELIARLEALGFKGRSKVTIATLRSDTLTTLAAARDAGLYSVEMD